MLKNKDITAVYSFNLCPNKTNYSGFNDLESFLSFLYLSVYYSKKTFKKVILYTTEEGKDLVNKYGIEFDEIDTSFENYKNKIEYKFWSIIKLYACSKQSEPFVHIDNDAALLKGLPKNILKSDCGFQGQEQIDLFCWYVEALAHIRFHPRGKKMQLAKLTKNVNKNNFVAYNCGIVYFGKVDKKLLKRWWRIAFAACLFWAKNYEGLNISNLLVFEQLAINILTNKNNMSVNFIIDENWQSKNYMHFLSGGKRSEGFRIKLKNRMQEQFPEFYKKIYES